MTPIREARQRLADEAGFERGPAAVLRPATVSGDYIRVQRPDADDTVHVPGEALPADVAAAVRAAGDDAYDHQARCLTVQIPAAQMERSRW